MIIQNRIKLFQLLKLRGEDVSKIKWIKEDSMQISIHHDSKRNLWRCGSVLRLCHIPYLQILKIFILMASTLLYSFHRRCEIIVCFFPKQCTTSKSYSANVSNHLAT